MELEVLAVVGEHLSHFSLRESNHLVETVVQGIVGADVEAAGEVVECHGTDTRDEDTLDTRISARLDGVEEGTQVARTVRLSLVFIQTGGIGEDVVGEVVVLVNEEINLCICLARFPIQMVKLFHTTVLFVHFLLDALGQVLLIDIAEIIEFRIAYRIQCTAVIAQVGIDHGKVEIDDKILVVVRRWMLADIQVAIESFELILLIDIIIMTEHRHGKALAEAFGADEEKESV